MFERLGAEVWKVADTVSSQRRDVLLQPTFEEILGEIISSATCLTGWERRANKCPILTHPPGTLVRYEMTFLTTSVASDLFHNGAGGIRAQYYVSEELGAEATTRAEATIARRLAELEPLPNEQAGLSVFHSTRANVWIVEDQWMKQSLPELCVPRWARPQTMDCVRYEKLRKWGSMMPVMPRLEVKGAWLLDNHRPLEPTPTPDRCYELNTFGYS